MGIRKVLHVYRTYFPDPQEGCRKLYDRLHLPRATVVCKQPYSHCRQILILKFFPVRRLRYFAPKSWAAPSFLRILAQQGLWDYLLIWPRLPT